MEQKEDKNKPKQDSINAILEREDDNLLMTRVHEPNEQTQKIVLPKKALRQT